MTCANENMTTYQYYFKSYPPDQAAVRAPKIQQCDPGLLSNNFATNIQINGAPAKTKAGSTRFEAEEYKHFLKRLECCKKDIFKLYYRCPDVDMLLLDKMIKNLSKSVYQVSYSPDEYVCEKKCKYPKSSSGLTNMKYCETTYGTYFNQYENVIRFMDVVTGLMKKENKEELKNELKKIYKMTTSTYIDTICVSAQESSKNKELKIGPIDRYTLRRV